MAGSTRAKAFPMYDDAKNERMRDDVVLKCLLLYYSRPCSSSKISVHACARQAVPREGGQQRHIHTCRLSAWSWRELWRKVWTAAAADERALPLNSCICDAGQPCERLALIVFEVAAL